MATSTLRSTLQLLFRRRLGTFLVASLLSNMGAWAQQVAEPWLLLTLGGTAWLVGLDGFALNAPVWGLTLIGGLLADRWDRRRAIVLFQSLQMFCPLLLLLLVWRHQVQPWEVIALSAVVGITDALSMPAFTSIVPSLVNSEELGSAFALNSTQFNLSRVLGPALAGLLLAQWGPSTCFGLNVLSYVPFIGVALWLLPRQGPAAPPLQAASPRELLSGLGRVFRTPALRVALAMVAISSVFCGPLITLCPVLMKEVLHRGAGEFGSALSAFGLGGLGGALGLVALEGKVKNRRRLGFGFALLNALAVLASAAEIPLGVLLGLLVLAGAALTASNTALNTLVQSTAEDHLRGQSASLYMLAMRGGLAAGNLLVGAAASAVGVRPALAASACVALLLQGLVYHSVNGSEPVPTAPGASSEG